MARHTVGTLPPGATDTHIHIYEPGYRTSELAVAGPEPEATLAEYRREMARLGLSRVVIVQPTTYGTDNSCTLAALAALAQPPAASPSSPRRPTTASSICSTPRGWSGCAAS